MSLREFKNRFEYSSHNIITNRRNYDSVFRLTTLPRYFDEKIFKQLFKTIGHYDKLILDIGSDLGDSVNWFCTLSNDTHVIAIDEWDDKFDLFTTNCWKNKFNVSPINDNILNSLCEIARYNIGPDVDVVFINKKYSYKYLKKLIPVIIDTFPNAKIYGYNDDYIEETRKLIKRLAPVGYQTIFYESLWRYVPKIKHNEECNVTTEHKSTFSNDLCFIINVYNETKILDYCLIEIRKFYPEVPIIIISDGIKNENHIEYAKKHNCYYYAGEHRIKLLKHGLLYWKRITELCLLTDSNMFIKIDPDTKLKNKLNPFPDADYFGHYGHKIKFGCSYNNLLQGCCKGITRKALIRLYESGEFENDNYKNSYYTREGRGYSGQLSEDKSLHDAVKRVGLKCEHYNGVCVMHRRRNKRLYKRSFVISGYNENNWYE